MTTNARLDSFFYSGIVPTSQAQDALNRGWGYTGGHFYSGVAASTSVNFLIRMGQDSGLSRFFIDTDTALSFAFYKRGSFSAAGTSVNSYCADDNYNYSSYALFSYGATVSGGNLVFDGMTAREYNSSMYAMAANTNYYLTISNLGSGNANFSVRLDLVEGYYSL